MSFDDLLKINSLVFGESVLPMVQIVRQNVYDISVEQNLDNVFVFTGKRSLLCVKNPDDEIYYIPFDDYYCLADIPSNFNTIVGVTNQYSMLGRGTDGGSEFVYGVETSGQQEVRWRDTISYFPSVLVGDGFRDMTTEQSYYLIRYPNTKVLR